MPGLLASSRRSESLAVTQNGGTRPGDADDYDSLAIMMVSLTVTRTEIRHPSTVRLGQPASHWH